MTSLLTAIRRHQPAADLLLWPGDFDLGRTEHVEEVRLASGEKLTAIAGDSSGGTFFFCGEGGEERPVLYADSEGGAALVAVGLPELVRLLLTVPWWQDCPGFTEQESQEAAADYLEDDPALLDDLEAAAAALGLVLPSEAEALTRLYEVATGLGHDYLLLNALEGTSYKALIAAR